MDLACDLVLKIDFHAELPYLENFQLAECEVRPMPTFYRGHIAHLFLHYKFLIVFYILGTTYRQVYFLSHRCLPAKLALMKFCCFLVFF